MQKKLREYRAIVWTAEPAVPGRRVRVLAERAGEAERRLRAQHGPEVRMTLWNEEGANRIREAQRSAPEIRSSA